MDRDQLPLLLITGCTGYLGAWVAKKACGSGGFRVRGTTRNPNSKRATKLKEQCRDIELVACELMKDDGWEAAFEGVTFLLHTASPFNVDPKMDFVKPAVEGTKRVLGFAASSGSVKRVAVTSSCVAMCYGTQPLEAREYGDQDWSQFPDENTSYEASKTFAEKAVWKWDEENPDISVCTVNPGLIVGASLLGTAGGTLDVWKMFSTAGMAAPIMFPICDVQDIAEIHVNALLNDEAAGMRIISAETVDAIELFQSTAEEFNPMGYKFPTSEMGSCILCCFFQCCCCCNPLAEYGDQINVKFSINNKLATSLTNSGKTRHWSKSTVEMTYDFIENGALPKKAKYVSPGGADSTPL